MIFYRTTKGVISMYPNYRAHPYPYCVGSPMFNMYNTYRWNPYAYPIHSPMHEPDYWREKMELKDYGPEPFVINIEEATIQNHNFRTALWTGNHLQVTLMCIQPGEDIGLELHPDVDQFIRIEEGHGIVKMGKDKNEFDFQEKVHDDDAIMIPAGTWHNVINTGHKPLKLYSIYAPPEHPRGTIHPTKEDAEMDENNRSHK